MHIDSDICKSRDPSIELELYSLVVLSMCVISGIRANKCRTDLDHLSDCLQDRHVGHELRPCTEQNSGSNPPHTGYLHSANQSSQRTLWCSPKRDHSILRQVPWSRLAVRCLSARWPNQSETESFILCLPLRPGRSSFGFPN